MEIRNAKITSTKLGREDHGIMTFMIFIEFSGCGCGVGGYALDMWDREAPNKRVFSAKGLEAISEILDVVGVDNWEDLKGQYIRIKDNGWGSTVDEIGKMSWSSPSDALKFENQIRSDKYLSSRRGQWTERFGGIQPFEHHFDLHIAQDFFYDKKNGRKIQAVVDFMNISNLFNRNWGLTYSQTLQRNVLNVDSLTKDAEGNMVPTYSYKPNDNYYTDFYSRWRCQVGLRLTF